MSAVGQPSFGKSLGGSAIVSTIAAATTAGGAFLGSLYDQKQVEKTPGAQASRTGMIVGTAAGAVTGVLLAAAFSYWGKK